MRSSWIRLRPNYPRSQRSKPANRAFHAEQRKKPIGVVPIADDGVCENTVGGRPYRNDANRTVFVSTPLSPTKRCLESG
jgi:hypothetical protein